MSTIAQSLAAGDIQPFSVAGQYLRLQSGSSLAIRFYRESLMVNESVNVSQGYAAKVPLGFDRFDVENLSGAAVDVQILIGTEGIEIDYAGDTGADSISSTPAATPAHSQHTVLASAASQLAAANASRKLLIVQNNGTDWLRVRIDGTAPTAAAGIRIAPGGYWDLPAYLAGAAIVQAIAESGAGCAVEVIEG